MSLTKTVDLSQVTLFQTRRFVPPQAQLMELAEIKGLYEKLLNRSIYSANELEQWVLDRSEMDAALSQVSSILYIRMTCQTDDIERANAYKKFIEVIAPALRPIDDQLNKKFLELLKKFPLNEDRYGIYIKKLKTNVELFRDENVPLQTQIDLLSQEYQTVCGAMSVQFEGKERTLPEMGKFLLETDRNLREKAWRATAQRRLQDKERLEDIFDKMLALRHKIAQNAGFKNYRDYKFVSLHRFDYTPQDCKQYQNSVEKLLVPLWKKVLESRREQMKVPSLRPWDTAVDPLGRSPLKPFEKVEDLISGCQRIFKSIDLDLHGQFSEMIQKGLLDLASRRGKAPGGYQSALDESRKPFIFMNAVGVDDDVRTLLHECGHAFHSLACAHDPLVEYRHGPMEFNEVASMGMELLADQFLSEFYNKEDESRSRESHLEGIIYILCWVATVDAFQHWIYENPQHNREDRRQAWLNISQRFSAQIVDWSGLGVEQSYLWHRQLHIFEVPFYYIEYGIAQLGALQLWLNANKNWKEALTNYRKALSLGGSKPLPELFSTAGLKFDFSEKTIAPLTEELKKVVF